MTSATIGGYASPREQLLAEHARNATKPGTCARCVYDVRAGQRVAHLVTGELVHAWCAAAVTGRTRA